ncbi:MAG: hypothetical protein WA192_10550 [Candidatus Acidiferrales bacterium]
MEESPQSYPASSWRKFRTPPLLPEEIEPPGIDLAAFLSSFRGNGATLSFKEGNQLAMAATRSGQKNSASATARQAIDVIRPEEPLA